MEGLQRFLLYPTPFCLMATTTAPSASWFIKIPGESPFCYTIHHPVAFKVTDSVYQPQPPRCGFIKPMPQRPCPLIRNFFQYLWIYLFLLHLPILRGVVLSSDLPAYLPTLHLGSLAFYLFPNSFTILERLHIQFSLVWRHTP